MTGNIYLDLTNEFNEGGLRAILSSGQAIVVYGLAFASKDGDWIVRETPESLDHILRVLERHGAHYRMGAPLDVRWMRGGWSAHFEFNRNGERIRCDFVTRPPRLAPDDLGEMWREHEEGRGREEPVPTIDLRRLAELKKTDRERDYPFIGEIARRVTSLAEQILLSRSARDLIGLWPQISAHEQAELLLRRPILGDIAQGREVLETSLDAERRALSRVNELRLAAYERAATRWKKEWTQLSREAASLSLTQAHTLMVKRAEESLPEMPNE